MASQWAENMNEVTSVRGGGGVIELAGMVDIEDIKDHSPHQLTTTCHEQALHQSVPRLWCMDCTCASHSLHWDKSLENIYSSNLVYPHTWPVTT